MTTWGRVGSAALAVWLTGCLLPEVTSQRDRREAATGTDGATRTHSPQHPMLADAALPARQAPDAGSPKPLKDAAAKSHEDAAVSGTNATTACDTSPCMNGGKCEEARDGPRCDCEGTGFSGPRCDTAADSCSDVRCDPGLSCKPPEGQCVAACRDAGCLPGDTCTQDADCKRDGAGDAVCDATEHKCVGKCSEGFTGHPLDPRIHYCTEVSGGDVQLQVKEEPCPTVWLPRLKRVEQRLVLRGAIPLASGDNMVRDAMCGDITFPQLESVGSTLDPSVGSATSMRFPKLTHVGRFSLTGGGKSQVGLLSMPALTAVDEQFTLTEVLDLRAVELGALEAVGTARVFATCHTPYSLVEPLQRLVGSETDPNRFELIGCCAANTADQYKCGGCLCACACE